MVIKKKNIYVLILNIILCYNNSGHRSMDELMQQSSTKNDDVATDKNTSRLDEKKIDHYSTYT